MAHKNKSCGLGEKRWTFWVGATSRWPRPTSLRLIQRTGMIKISDVPLTMWKMSGNKSGEYIYLRKMSSQSESSHGHYLHETSLHHSHCKYNWDSFGVVGKVAFKKRRQIADLFLRVSYASLLPLKKFSPSSKDYLVSSWKSRLQAWSKILTQFANTPTIEVLIHIYRLGIFRFCIYLNAPI